jgi:hypothetical protein
VVMEMRPSRVMSKGPLLPALRRFFRRFGPESQVDCPWVAERVGLLRARGVAVEVLGPVGVGVLVRLEFDNGAEAVVRLMP